MPDGSRRTIPKILILNNENPAWPSAALVFARAMLSRLQAAFSEQGYTAETYVQMIDCLVSLAAPRLPACAVVEENG